MASSKKQNRNRFRELRDITNDIESAIRLIELHASEKHLKLDFSTKIPYGIGVDVPLLNAFSKLRKVSPELAQEWFSGIFDTFSTVGEIIEFEKAVIEKFSSVVKS